MLIGATYLGDGVYIGEGSYSGELELFTYNGVNKTNIIYLGPEETATLLKFLQEKLTK